MPSKLKHRYCTKCGRKMIRTKTDIMVRAALSNPEDPYDGPYKPVYFYFCKCQQIPKSK